MRPPALYGIWDDQTHRLIQGGFWGVDGRRVAVDLVETTLRGLNRFASADDAHDWEVIPVCLAHHDQPADDCWDCADKTTKNREKR